ncbi:MULTISPECIES: SAM-dependent methyltransferase [Streptomyces]|uniref:SAM-dependent methyltransferase n=1 Tax=Streptomyces TaxID=1883 RepID=UPI000B9EE6AF|nr:SAM-dependent methyltransferase [Streptomyces kasugaensis]
MPQGEKPHYDQRPVDTEHPSVARMYDYYLGGRNNYEVDRIACAELLAMAPSAEILARINRRFLRRVVHILAAEYGVKQFIDHGFGLPAQDNVHEVARRAQPDARVIYIDNDPIVAAHGKAILRQDANTDVIQADIRDTSYIFSHPSTCRLIDPDQPTAALFTSVLHCIPDGDGPAELIRRVTDRLFPGSFLVICQLVSDEAQFRSQVTEFMNKSMLGNWGRVRERHEVDRYFDGLEILSPGYLTDVSEWRPEDLVLKQPGGEWIEYGGVGCIPAH